MNHGDHYTSFSSSMLFDIVILIVRINFHTRPREVPLCCTIRLLSRSHSRDTAVPFADQRKLNKKANDDTIWANERLI